MVCYSYRLRLIPPACRLCGIAMCFRIPYLMSAKVGKIHFLPLNVHRHCRWLGINIASCNLDICWFAAVIFFWIYRICRKLDIHCIFVFKRNSSATLRHIKTSAVVIQRFSILLCLLRCIIRYKRFCFWLSEKHSPNRNAYAKHHAQNKCSYYDPLFFCFVLIILHHFPPACALARHSC